jgi:hypothetical protein
MQDDDPPIHDRAIEDPRDSCCGLEAKLEQPAAHRAGMGHAQVWAKRLHPFRVSQESRNQAGRQGQDALFDALTVEGDGPRHDGSIAYSLCPPLASIRGDRSRKPRQRNDDAAPVCEIDTQLIVCDLDAAGERTQFRA